MHSDKKCLIRKLLLLFRFRPEGMTCVALISRDSWAGLASEVLFSMQENSESRDVCVSWHTDRDLQASKISRCVCCALTDGGTRMSLASAPAAEIHNTLSSSRRLSHLETSVLRLKMLRSTWKTFNWCHVEKHKWFFVIDLSEIEWSGSLGRVKEKRGITMW